MAPADSAPNTVGLSTAELDQTVGSFFDGFCWEGAQLDLESMTPEQFFERF